MKELLRRARSVLGKKIRYKLGAGGIDPTSPTPANIDNACDCSGYVCWCLGVSRKTDHPLYVHFNGGWINTDAIVYDAQQMSGFFKKLDEPKTGCLIVYPSKRPRRRYGHVGIVTKVEDKKVIKVIHCSLGNFKRFNDAVQETPPTIFQSLDTMFTWYDGIED